MSKIASRPHHSSGIVSVEGGQIQPSGEYQDFFDDVVQKTNDAVLGEAFNLPSYLKAAMPTASSYTGGLIYVSDEIGGATVAFSDGVDWRRVQDRAIVS